MQEQGKRLLLAVALALGVMMLWQVIFPPKKPDEPPPGTGSGSGSTKQAPAPTPTSRVGQPDPTTAAVPGPTAPAAPRSAEQLIELKYPSFTATFSSYGGTLQGWHLSDPRYDRDATKGELLVGTLAERKERDAKLAALDTGAFDVNFSDSTYIVPKTAEWHGTKVDDRTVKYTYTSDALDIEKTFIVEPNWYMVRMTVKITVKVPEGKEAHQTLAIRAYEWQDPRGLGGGSSRVAARVWASSTYRDDSVVGTSLEDLVPPEGGPRFEKDITWTGFEHPYLLVAFAPKRELNETYEKHTYAYKNAELIPYGLIETDILYPRTTFKHGDAPLTREMIAYLGPKNYDDLANADNVAGYATGFKAPIDFGWFGFIGRPLLWLLQKFYSVVGNWGISIILLTFLVKGITLFWTTKSMRSMKAMAALAPQMKEIQAKYKDDRQRQQAETMALYKENNVNPLSGCLPIVMQMPIWLALYRMLSNAGELYQQPFVPGWINDLTASDPVYVLPVVLVVTMFFQARLTPQTGSSGQQKMLQYGMPLMFGVMSFFFPAGLTLYIFTNTCLSALHSIYMNKYDKKSLEIAAKLKANQAAAEAAKNPGAKKVIDAQSKDVGSDDDDDGDDDAAAKSTAGKSAQARNRRNNNKKRRR
jgi:YidC/Oxa1 family membrane protein insertase